MCEKHELETRVSERHKPGFRVWQNERVSPGPGFSKTRVAIPSAHLAQTTAKFGHNSSFGNLLPKPKLCTKFEVASFNGCRHKYGFPNFSDAPLAQPSPLLVLNVGSL